jgi:hypothetical protein
VYEVMRRKNAALEKGDEGSRDEGHQGKLKECTREGVEGRTKYKHDATI